MAYKYDCMFKKKCNFLSNMLYGDHTFSY
uniref:Uncharacterized protein n=1 Tax=Lepeophtheirus salmonis TaxID=72036 RepID=A0A0K2SYS6_LEPSM